MVKLQVKQLTTSMLLGNLLERVEARHMTLLLYVLKYPLKSRRSALSKKFLKQLLWLTSLGSLDIRCWEHTLGALVVLWREMQTL